MARPTVSPTWPTDHVAGFRVAGRRCETTPYVSPFSGSRRGATMSRRSPPVVLMRREWAALAMDEVHQVECLGRQVEHHLARRLPDAPCSELVEERLVPVHDHVAGSVVERGRVRAGDLRVRVHAGIIRTGGLASATSRWPPRHAIRGRQAVQPSQPSLRSRAAHHGRGLRAKPGRLVPEPPRVRRAETCSATAG